MLSLLGGLLFRPRAVIEQVISQPDRDQTSRVNSFVMVLIMINFAFMMVSDELLSEQVSVIGNFKWVLVLLLPPLFFFVQRFLQVLFIRIGMFLFARKHLPADREERRESYKRVKMAYAYTVFPSFVFTLISLPVQSAVMNFFFFTIGLAYTLFLTAHMLRKLFGVSSAVGIFAPLVVQFLFGIVISLILAVFLLVFSVM